jgi:hypothetical protein
MKGTVGARRVRAGVGFFSTAANVAGRFAARERNIQSGDARRTPNRARRFWSAASIAALDFSF